MNRLLACLAACLFFSVGGGLPGGAFVFEHHGKGSPEQWGALPDQIIQLKQENEQLRQNLQTVSAQLGTLTHELRGLRKSSMSNTQTALPGPQAVWSFNESQSSLDESEESLTKTVDSSPSEPFSRQSGKRSGVKNLRRELNELKKAYKKLETRVSRNDSKVGLSKADQLSLESVAEKASKSSVNTLRDELERLDFEYQTLIRLMTFNDSISALSVADLEAMLDSHRVNSVRVHKVEDKLKSINRKLKKLKERVRENDAKVGITLLEQEAIQENSSKVSFPGFGNFPGTALEGDTTIPDLTGYASEEWIADRYGIQLHLNKSAIDDNRELLSMILPKRMMPIPAGHFLFGREKEKVFLPSYFIDKYPVTSKQYQECVAAKASGDPTGCDYVGGAGPFYEEYHTYNDEKLDHPINYVNWHEASTYCAWKKKRLPSQHEWEKAARGNDGREYPWGHMKPTNNHANFWQAGESATSERGTTPVGYYNGENGTVDSKSPYGVYDMIGNVWEWTLSFVEINNSTMSVLRGGSLGSSIEHVHVSSSLHLHPSLRRDGFGFRCVR